MRSTLPDWMGGTPEPAPRATPHPRAARPVHHPVADVPKTEPTEQDDASEVAAPEPPVAPVAEPVSAPVAEPDPTPAPESAPAEAPAPPPPPAPKRTPAIEDPF